MSPFTFYSVPTIVFGVGKITELGDIARSFGRRALVIHNGSNVGGGGAVDKAADSLRKSNLDVTFYRQRGEPTVANVDEALAAARNCDLLIGVGGGSAIDCAKAVAGTLTNGGSALDYMEVIGAGKKITKPAAPWIAVPTTAGTGAEVTRNAVIGSPQHKYKASIRSELLMARVALIDPELATGAPREVTAASGMDAIVQCLESATSRAANEMTRPISLSGLAEGRALRNLLSDHDTLEDRERMAFAALQGGIALTNAGLGAVHGFAAPLGAHFPAPHGVICGVLLPHVVEANIKALFDAHDPLLEGYVHAGRYLANLPDFDEYRALDYVAKMCRALTALADLPRLSTYGVTESVIPEIVAMAKKSSSMRYNPVALSDDVLAGILRAAL